MHLRITIYIAFILLFLNNSLSASSGKTTDYETFTSSNRVRSGIALGGIGAGSLELRKDGNFYNWSIFNNYPLGTGPHFKLPVLPDKKADDGLLFFLVRYQVEGEQPKIKLLQLNNSLQEGGMDGIIYYYPWMSGVEKIQYKARFPFVNMLFTDPEMPFVIKLEAFSPFIPHDVKNSSMPGIFFKFNITSLTTKKVDVMLTATLRNLVAYDQTNKAFYSELIKTDSYQFFTHKVKGIDQNLPTFGQMGLGVLGGSEISHYLGWEHKHPYYEKLLISTKLSDIDDTKNRNFINSSGLEQGRIAADNNDQRCFSSIAISHELKNKSGFEATFFMNWYFPNAYGAVNNNASMTEEERKKSDYKVNLTTTKRIGHAYENHFRNIQEVVSYFSKNKDFLSDQSHQFVNNMYASDIDETILNQINSQLNTFVSSSTLDKNGNFGIREGLTPEQSWGPNGTLDVSLYGSPMIIALFPELQQAMMKAHLRLQTPDGEVNHGLGYDMDYNQNGTWGVFERVDLAPNFIQMVLRDYLWTNDSTYINQMWPAVKKAIHYILTKKDLNGDQMPDMNGIMCSYDNFPMYGLASYIQTQWIAALTMAAEVAQDMNEPELATEYKKIATKGSRLMEEKLWNGAYYNLSNDYTGTKGIDNGCLTDQLIGQWVLKSCGLGYIVDSTRVKTALKSVMQRSFINNSFLRNCSWPAYPDLFPIHASDLWVDQANTPWTGVELAFASFLIQEGMVLEGEELIKSVDARYKKAGLYFDHQEFGGHYYRPMSAWAIMNAYAGMSINTEKLSFAPNMSKKNYKLYFVTPYCTGFFIKHAKQIKIEILTGQLNVSEISILVPELKRVKNCQINSKTNSDIKISEWNKHIIIKLAPEYVLNNKTVLTIQ